MPSEIPGENTEFKNLETFKIKIIECDRFLIVLSYLEGTANLIHVNIFINKCKEFSLFSIKELMTVK